LDQIPDYVPEELPKRKFYSDTVTIITEKDPKKLKPAKNAKAENLIMSEETFESWKLRLETEWEKQNIPEAQREPYRDCVQAVVPDQAKELIKKELEDLQKGKASVELALRAVAAREESLKSVKEMNDYLKSSPDWQKVKEVQLEAAELLHAHRMLTLNAIEAITKWRNQMQSSFSLGVHNFPFMWEGENYLLKLRDDLDFLKLSEYSKVLYFGDDPDPLLVYPSVPSGKVEKNRKRDPNYFINDGQVIVPLPSTISGRVKEAEEIIRNEYDWIRAIEENDPKRLANFYGPDIGENYIDEVINEFLKDFGDEVQEEKDDLEKKRLKAIEDEDIAEKIYLSLLDSLNIDIEELAKEEYVEQKLKAENNKKKNLEENDKISKSIYKSLKDELIHTNLTGLSEEMMKLIARELKDENELYERGNIIEEMGLDFANIEAFNNLSGVMWVPIGISENYIEEALEEYYRFIPSINKELVPDINQLMIEVTKAMDTRWYWAIRQNIIFALLVFSIDCYSKTGRKLIVHHLSSLYWRSFPAIVESATSHIWSIDACDEIRISMFGPKGSDLSPEIKKVLNTTKYKWKAQYTLKEANYDVTIFGRSKPNTPELPVSIPFKLKACCQLDSGIEPIPYNNIAVEEMGQIGNRQIFLNSLLGLIGVLEKALVKVSSKAGTPLQREISEIINLMNQTQKFSFPNMKSITSLNQYEIDEFCRSININLTQMQGQKTSLTCLEINFRWVSCTNVVQTIREKKYKYMRLKSNDIICSKVEDTEVFTVPTELPNVSAFFITNKSIEEEINKTLQDKLDVFYLTERLMLKGEKTDIHEFWVPCFNKDIKWTVPWIEGYELVQQKEDSNQSYIVKCTENTTLEIDQQILTQGLLIISEKKGPILIHDFIFGLMYTKGDKILDIPLFCCLVQEKDWIKA
jgi:hypothetical protein